MKTFFKHLSTFTLLSVFLLSTAFTMSAQNQAATAAANTDQDSLVMCVFGDSYVRNHRRPFAEAWHAKVAGRLGYKYVNCGRNGSSMGYDRTKDGFGKAMTDRLSELPDRADVFIIIAGHNDADLIAKGAPYSLDDFAAALNTLIDSLRAKYPGVAIGYVTPWAVDRPMFPEVIASIKEVCAKRGVPVLDAASTSGIDPNDPEFRARFFQGPKDTAHLNDAGHNLLLDWGEAFVSSLRP